MHEWALAEAVVETIKKIMLDKKVKAVKRVEIRVGELQNIDLKVFEFALSELLKGASLVNVQIEFRKGKATFKCRRCQHEWKLRDIELREEELEAVHFMPELIHAFTSCPKCGSCDFDIVEGRGVWIERIEGI